MQATVDQVPVPKSLHLCVPSFLLLGGQFTEWVRVLESWFIRKLLKWLLNLVNIIQFAGLI
jgi:hypothetical protein